MKIKADRKALVAHYKETRPDAGVYRIINTIIGSYHLDWDTDIKTIAGKMDFARTTGIYGVFPLSLAAEMQRDGFQHYSLEILEQVPVKAETSAEELKEELMLLAELWQEKLKG